MKGLYDLMGLTPYRAVFVHLLLLGIPFRWGWLLLREPCHRMFHSVEENTKTCSDVELFAISDFGVRYILFYQLAWVVALLMRTSTNVAVAFHKILLGTSIGTMLVLAYMQPKLISGRREPLDADFSFQWALCYCLACGLSFWTILVHPKATPESMKWSIPANAIFSGGVINLFLAVASFQALMEESGLERYYRTDNNNNGGVVTPIVRFSFTIGAAYTAIHSILLLRIRTFLTVSQLRSVCLYKLLVNLLLPLVWMPEMSPFLQVNQQIAFAIRASVTLTYLFGYLWAGKAEGVSRILTSEKED